ncbi:MAG: branched-chain amino acid ABC transporter permease [Pyrobaculum sp.]
MEIIDYSILVRAIIFSNIFALLALGLNLTYITTRIPSFAHGDLATVGAYTSYFALIFLFTPLGIDNIYLTFPLVALAGALVGLASYMGVFRPLIRRGASITTLMIASFGLHYILYAPIAMILDYVQSVYRVLTRNILLTRWELIWPGLDLPTSTLINSTIVLILTLTGLYILLYKTRYGIVMRASIDNLYTAKSLGVNVERVFAVAWLLIGAVTAIAGVYMAMVYPATAELGWLRLPLIFVASVVGGLGNIYGAVLGGYVVGTSIVLGEAYLLRPLNIPTEFQLLIPLIAVIIILLIAPQGLVGLISKITQKKV